MGGGGDNSALSSLGGFMRLLGIGDNSERVVIRGSDFEMMQMVAEEVRYLLDEQDFVQHTHVSVSYTHLPVNVGLQFVYSTYRTDRSFEWNNHFRLYIRRVHILL